MMAENKPGSSRRDDWIRCDEWGRFRWDYGDHMDKFSDNEVKGVKADWVEYEGTKKVAYTKTRSDSGWNYKKGWGFHRDGEGPGDGGEPPGIWLAEDINILSGVVNAPKRMVGNKLESYIIALSYSVPDGVWPDNVVNACRWWFVRYGPALSCEWNPYSGKWKWNYGLGVEKDILTRDKISLALRTAPEHYLQADEADCLAGGMMTALEDGKMFSDKEYVIDDLYQEEEEQETMARTLYEVFTVNVLTGEVIDVEQVVAESDDKAKMKAMNNIEWGDDTPADVDDLDFFAVEIGRVRNAPDSCSC